MQIGQSFELPSDDGPEPYFPPADWLLKVVHVNDGGDPVNPGAYRTEALALASVDSWMFAPNRGWLVARHIERARNAGNIDLVIKLAEGRGRTEGYAKGQEQLATLKAKVLAAVG